MSTTVEQLLHGYRRGHERLAGSLKLSARDAELVTRLSDLSGTLATSTAFGSYLTAYPLPSGSYYAIAQTWPDIHAPRSGCVLTHTLLVPLDAWRTSCRPSDVAALFRSPVGRVTDDVYERSLRWLSDVEDLGRPRSHVPIEPHLDFVYRYFAQAKQPIVWFGNPEPMSTVWLLLEGLWPALRARFAVCTFCLQPRSLEDRPFDLMFAPTDAYPRFLKIPPDHLVDWSRSPTTPARDNWCQRWTQRLFATAFPDDTLDDDLWKDLDDDPTAIRRLYLIDAAMRAAGDDPLAAVGAMDLVESVARAPEAALHAKSEAARRAVSVAASATDVAKGLESLRLIEDRLRRGAYVRTGPRVGPLIADAVCAYTIRDAEAVASISRATADLPIDGDSSWYCQGLVEGFRRLSHDSPAELLALRELPAIGARLFSAEPAIALAYGRALFAKRSRSEIRKVLSDWLTSINARALRPELRRALLPLVNVDDSDLLPDLLEGLTGPEVPDVLNALRKSLTEPHIERAIEQFVAIDYPVETRTWLTAADNWTRGLAALTAATYAPNRKGVEELLSDEGLRGEQCGPALALLLVRVGRGRLPAWLRALATEDPRIFVSLLDPRHANDSDVEAALVQLARECEALRLAHYPDVLRLIPTAARRRSFPHLLDVTLQDLIRGYVDGTVSEKDTLPLLRSEHAVRWIQGQSNWIFKSLLTHDVWTRSPNWLNAWRLLLIVPDAFYERDPGVVPEVIDTLLRANSHAWSPAVAENWRGVLSRCRSTRISHTRLVLSVQALKFSLDNPGLPLSGVVAETFLDVYAAVTSSDRPPRETSSLFSIWDWDKGKELRKALIDAFISSGWPPGDLALAVRGESLLRKIFKRTQRKYGGEQYLHSVLNDLQQRTGAEAQHLHGVLEALLRKPDFYEEWD